MTCGASASRLLHCWPCWLRLGTQYMTHPRARWLCVLYLRLGPRTCHFQHACPDQSRSKWFRTSSLRPIKPPNSLRLLRKQPLLSILRAAWLLGPSDTRLSRQCLPTTTHCDRLPSRASYFLKKEVSLATAKHVQNLALAHPAIRCMLLQPPAYELEYGESLQPIHPDLLP